MEARFIALIFLGKLVSFVSKLTNLGAGATWPGEVALRLDPEILSRFSQQGRSIILIAGTNGKTTTVKMIETILKNAGKKVRRNQSGANLDNGLISTFIEDADLSGRLTSDYFIFEVDEATLPNILKQITPTIILLNNLFRDQLDRYGEVDTIAEKWKEALKLYSSSDTALAGESRSSRLRSNNIPMLIINADDPHLAYIGSQLATPVKYFGLENTGLFIPKMQHATDTIFCPRCGSRLTFGGVYFSHLGKWACGKCGLTHPEVSIKANDFRSPLEGVYNQYNTIAAASVCRELGLSDNEIKEGLMKFTPAFGRMETINVNGKSVKILLSKNPTGFNESLRTVFNSKQTGPLLLVLNDRIPDGTDISWIWDVDFEVIPKATQILVSGDRCYDMGLRLKYAEVPVKGIYSPPAGEAGNLEEAVNQALKLTKVDEALWILPTYSAMLEVREILTGRKIL